MSVQVVLQWVENRLLEGGMRMNEVEAALRPWTLILVSTLEDGKTSWEAIVEALSGRCPSDKKVAGGILYLIQERAKAILDGLLLDFWRFKNWKGDEKEALVFQEVYRELDPEFESWKKDLVSNEKKGD